MGKSSHVRSPSPLVRAANPSDGLRWSGAASRFGGGHDGVLSCGRKRERIPDRTHVLAHERMHEYEHPRTASCRQERKRASAHARLPASLHGFVQTIMPSPIHAPLLSRLNTAENTIKYCLRGRYSANCSDPAPQLRPTRTDILENVGEGRPETDGNQATPV